MKLTVFQSDKGDCLLAEAADGTRMLVDGGMRGSYSKHVAPALGALREAGGALDLVYVSHIDRDHIAGVLKLLDDEVAWRVFEFQTEDENPNVQEPDVPRPPEVRAIWHNGFGEMTGQGSKPIQDMLAATAAVLAGSDNPLITTLAANRRQLAASVAEAIQVSRRIGDKQLGIPLNQEFEGKLAMVRDGAGPVVLGAMSLTVIGPFAEDLEKLRGDWKKWIDDNRARLTAIRRQAREDEDLLSAGDIMAPQRRQAAELAVEELRLLSDKAARLGITLDELGDRDKVTTPNLASLMLLLEADSKKLLLTGDGHADDIIRGFEQSGHLNAGETLTVDVLKVQHHASEHNVNEEFCRRIIAGLYIFCANGSDENPDLRAVRLIAERRMEHPGEFEFLFNCSSEVAGADARREHMAKVEELAAELVEQSAGKMKVQFLSDSSVEIRL